MAFKKWLYVLFFQRKIEWVGLLERHPEAFEEAKALEKTAVENDSSFTWVQNESLEQLSKPERIEQIKREMMKKQNSTWVKK